MNVRINLQFDGTNYCGWQIQPEKPTVQGIISEAVYQITGQRVTVHGCGRTDSGVHASGYVASFETDSNIPVEKIPYALNSKLPQDIICTSAMEVEPVFLANRSAVAKTYRYTVDNNQFPDIFLQRFAWHYKYPLDEKQMQRAAEAFIGTHDFAGFAASGFSVKTTVRTIHSINVEKKNNIITIDVTGNGFLYNMVRIIAGTLVYAGNGRIKPEAMPDIIKSRCRQKAGITAPAKGLCLKEVFY